MKIKILSTLFALASASALYATSPYTGMQKRELKSYSQDQINDLRAGKGMGYALAAELNGVPGPLHTLELADKLKLNSKQLEDVKQLFSEMKSSSIKLGEDLLDKEKHLEGFFQSGSKNIQQLEMMTGHISQIQGQLRANHLKYHLLTATLLSDEQIKLYVKLRGYDGENAHNTQHKHKH